MGVVFFKLVYSNTLTFSYVTIRSLAPKAHDVLVMQRFKGRCHRNPRETYDKYSSKICPKARSQQHHT